MALSASYSAIPPSGEQPHCPGANDGAVSRNDSYSPSTRIAVEARSKWLYLLLGCAILLPWNAIANGSSFFVFRLGDSPFAATFGSYFAVTFTWSKLAFQLYCTITSKRSSQSRRIIVSVVAMILLVVCLWSSTFIRGTPSSFFPFVLSVTGSLAAAAACLGTAVYAKAAVLGPSFLQAVLSGQAAIAFITSAVNVMSCLVSLWGSSPKPASMDIVEMRVNGRNDQPEEIAARIFFGVFALFFCITLFAYVRSTRPSHESVSGVPEGQGQAEECTRLLSDDCGNHSTEAESHIYQVFKQNLSYMFSIAYAFTVTLSIFPGITIRVRPANPAIHPMLFTALHLLVLNIADLIGRTSCSSAHLSFWTAKKILVLSLLRTLLIPMILVCNINRPATTSSVLPIMISDIFFMLVVATLGYTLGIVMTLATLRASSLEHNPTLKGRRENVEAAGMLSGALVVVGLAVGSLFSFGVQAMI